MSYWNHPGLRAAAAALVVAGAAVSTAPAQTLRMITPGEAMLRTADTPMPAEISTAAAATNPFAEFRPATAPMARDGEAADLPTSPGALLQAPQAVPVPAMQQPLRANIMPPQDPVSGHEPPIAHRREKYIPAGYAYHHLTAGDKVYIGFRDLYSVGNFGAIFLSAGYEQITNGAPNYGTDRGAFGQRLGAAGIRETSQGIFTDCIFSPLFREDPRYFVEGPNHPLVNRAFHVVSRVFVTRTDNGGHTVNAALLAGYAATTALQSTYYPQINRNFKDGASEFAGSLGGAALGFAFDEFSDDLLVAIHLKKKP